MRLGSVHLFVSFILSSSLCFAQTQVRTLVISGGGSQFSNYPRYYNVSKLAYEVSTKRGWPVQVAATDGKWDFAASPTQIGPAQTKDDIEKQITAATKDMKPGDSLLLFITDHGEGPTSDSAPLSGGLVLYNGSGGLEKEALAALLRPKSRLGSGFTRPGGEIMMLHSKESFTEISSLIKKHIELEPKKFKTLPKEESELFRKLLEIAEREERRLGGPKDSGDNKPSLVAIESMEKLISTSMNPQDSDPQTGNGGEAILSPQGKIKLKELEELQSILERHKKSILAGEYIQQPRRGGRLLMKSGSLGEFPSFTSAPDLSHQELLEYLKTHVPSDATLRLVGVHCFSGGIHNIAFALPNACSSAATDFKTTHLSTPEIALYGEGFWDAVEKPNIDLNGDGTLSFYEAHVAGLLRDINNGIKGQISSSAYIDFVTHTGAYGSTPSTDGEGGRELKNLYGILERTFPRDPFYAKLLGGNDQSLVCSVEQTASNEIEQLAGQMDQIISKISPGSASTAITGKLPSELESVGRTLRTWWDTNKSNFRAELEKIQAEYKKTKQEFDQLEPEEQSKRNAEYTVKFDQLEEQARERLSRFLVYYRLASDISKAKEFLETPSVPVEQKEKFLQLHRCEWGPL